MDSFHACHCAIKKCVPKEGGLWLHDVAAAVSIILPAANVGGNNIFTLKRIDFWKYTFKNRHALCDERSMGGCRQTFVVPYEWALLEPSDSVAKAVCRPTRNRDAAIPWIDVVRQGSVSKSLWIPGFFFIFRPRWRSLNGTAWGWIRFDQTTKNRKKDPINQARNCNHEKWSLPPFFSTGDTPLHVFFRYWIPRNPCALRKANIFKMSNRCPRRSASFRQHCDTFLFMSCCCWLVKTMQKLLEIFTSRRVDSTDRAIEFQEDLFVERFAKRWNDSTEQNMSRRQQRCIFLLQGTVLRCMRSRSMNTLRVFFDRSRKSKCVVDVVHWRPTCWYTKWCCVLSNSFFIILEY